MPWERNRSVRGRTLFVTTMVVLISSEFAGICVSGFVDGRVAVRQAMGFAVVEGGAMFVFMGGRGARPIVGSALLAIAAWGAWHLVTLSHDASVHAVLLTTQTSLRLAGALVLLGSAAVADYIEQLSMSGDGGRRGTK